MEPPVANEPTSPADPPPDGRGWPAPPRQADGVGRAIRGRLFMGGMIALGSFYLLMVVALIGGNISYINGQVTARIVAQHREQAVAAGKAPDQAAPVRLGEQVAGWGRFARETLWNPRIGHATMLSFLTSTATVIIAMLVGIPTAYILSRRRFWGISIIDTMLDIPIVLPPLVVGVSLLIFFQTDVGRWINAWFDQPGDPEKGWLVFKPAGIVVAQFAVACAFGIRTLKATFQQLDPRIETVARTLGASRGQVFYRLTLPMSRDGVLAAAVMTWARAIGEFGPILIFSGAMERNTEVLPTAIFLRMSLGDMEGALAISTLMVAIAIATLLLFKKIGGIRYV